MDRKQTTPERVKEKTVRIIAIEVIIISSLTIILKQPALILLLGIDFLIRAFIGSRYSILALFAKSRFWNFLPLRKRMILLRPKKFAAGIGGLLAISAGLSGISNHLIIMISITSVLLLFSFLEAFFKFCAGCLMFGTLIQLKLIEEDNCTDCKFTTE